MNTLFPSRVARLLAMSAIFGLLATSGAASATVTTFSKEATFDVAASNPVAYSFPVGPGDGSFEARPYIVGPLGFSTYQHFTHPYLENDGAYGVGQTYLALTGVPGVNAGADTLVDGIYSLGFNIGTYDGADTITVTINFGETVGTFNTAGGAGQSRFFGIVSTDPIQQISFTARTGTQIDFLDFKAGTISAVPEPASLVLAMAGLGFVGVVARRRKAMQP